jgi:hypothetical protein
LTATGEARSLPVGSRVGVFRAKRVSMGTLRATDDSTTPDVRQMRHRFEVVESDAAAVRARRTAHAGQVAAVAQMVDVLPVGRSHLNLPGDGVGVASAAVPVVDNAIALVVYVSLPVRTTRQRVGDDLRPEALSEAQAAWTTPSSVALTVDPLPAPGRADTRVSTSADDRFATAKTVRHGATLPCL